jgi:hypothetical protein
MPIVLTLDHKISSRCARWMNGSILAVTGVFCNHLVVRTG